MKLDEKHRNLTCENKSDIMKKLGHEFNFFPPYLWTYNIQTAWWGKKTTLLVYFDQEEVVKMR